MTQTPRALSLTEQAELSRLELQAETAEAARDFRAAAIAWGKGRDLCRAAGQMDSAALWERHAIRAAGLSYNAAAKAARAAARKAQPKAARLSLFGLPVSIR